MAQETSIEYIKGDSKAAFYSGEPKYRKLIHEWAQTYSSQVKIRSEDDCGILAYIPVSWVRPPKPPAKRQMTPEQKQLAAERLKKAREAKNST